MSRIQVGDTVQLGSPDSARPYLFRVEQDGNFTVPSLGTFVAVGKAVGELHDEIVKKDPRYGRFPLSLCACALIYYVTGEIKSPGPKPFMNRLKVSQAIETAGGFTELANKKRVTLRHDDGKSETVKLGDSPQRDAQVFPGDTITVRRRGLFAR